MFFEEFFNVGAFAVASLDDGLEFVEEGGVEFVLFEGFGGVHQGDSQLMGLLLEGPDSLLEFGCFDVGIYLFIHESDHLFLLLVEGRVVTGPVLSPLAGGIHQVVSF